MAAGSTSSLPSTATLPSASSVAGLLNCDAGIRPLLGTRDGPRILSWVGKAFQARASPRGGDDVALTLVELDCLPDRDPGLGGPSGAGEHGRQLEQGVAVLVEEVGPGRQRDRRARLLLSLPQASAGSLDPGLEPEGDHLGQQILPGAGVAAGANEPLR